MQTDKAIYKPGDKVKYRVLILNPSLRPVSTILMDVHFLVKSNIYRLICFQRVLFQNLLLKLRSVSQDGRGNRIKEWRKQSTSHGIFSSEFQLSEHPVLGTWNITVNVVDQIFHKSFEVAEYVLPKFEVKVTVPQHASFKDGNVVAVINAK